MKVRPVIDFEEAAKILEEALSKKFGVEVTGVDITSYDQPRISIDFQTGGMFNSSAFGHRMHDYNKSKNG